jgi:hypothetical protein
MPGDGLGKLRRIEIDLDVHRAIERARRSFGESENEILRRLLVRPRKPSASGQRRRSPQPATLRVRGQWAVELGGKRQPAANMSDAYRLLLLALEDATPGFLDRFAEEGTRSRRFVAPEPGALYKDSPHLARQFGRHLHDDWYYDANLSADQVGKRARIAARLAGLAYGRDVRLLDNLREI